MRERMEQLAAGRMDIPMPELEILVPDIEEAIACGQVFRGDIRISSGNGVPFRGLIYSDDSRVTLFKNTYAGISSYIQYEVNAEQMDPGSELAGSFSLVYNGGERRIPYLFRVRAASSRDDKPYELADFAYLAKTDPASAAELFESREFLKLPFMEDIKLKALYEGLNRGPVRRCAMEEFLTGAGAKEKVTVSPVNDGFDIITEGHEIKRDLVLTRSCEGSILIRLAADQEWITIPAAKFTDADFDGDELRIPFIVTDTGLHAGKNTGAINVVTDTGRFRVPVSARRHVPVPDGPEGRIAVKKTKLEFLNTMLDLLAEKGNRAEHLDYLQYCWEEMTGGMEPGGIEKLYRAAISLWKGDRELAVLVLEDAEREIQAARREDPDAYCAFLYLDALASDSWQKKETLIKILKHFGELDRETLFMFLLLLHLDEGMANMPTECLEGLKNYYRKGSRSPFLYLEAVRIYNRHPDIVRKLDDFTCAVLADTAKRGYVSRDTAAGVAALAASWEGNAENIIRILELLYEHEPANDVLAGICALLIRAGKRDPESFKWFKLGVENDIRLTKLYDYYLYTAPRDHAEPLPKEIIFYFSYNSPRDPASQALLYNDLFRNYSKDRQIMDAYAEPMKKFVKEQAMAGTADSEMALLYERLLETDDVNERMAVRLPDILNARQIDSPDPTYQEAVVVYGEREEEYQTAIRDGKAVFPVYSPRAVLLFVDADGIRRSGDIAQAKPLMDHIGALEERCRELDHRHQMMKIKETLRILSQERKSERELKILRKELETAPGLTRLFKNELARAIADAVTARTDPREDEVISCVRYNGLGRERRLALTELLIRMNRLSEAAGQIRRTGYRELPVSGLRQFAERSIQGGLFTKDELLLDLCMYLFNQGQASDLVLEYLCTHYNAASQDMRPVLLAAASRDLQMSDMAERLLAQMLFTGERGGMDDVFRIYVRQAKTEPLLLKAYYVTKCAGYFRNDEPAGEYVFKYAEVSMENEEKDEASDIMELALIRYYAAKDILLPEESRRCGMLMDRLYREGKLFSFMKDLEGKIRLPEEIRHREVIEYRGEAGKHLELTMTLLPDRRGMAPLKLSIPQVTAGIYVKTVLLFAGDELFYEIRDEDGKKLASGTIIGKASDENDRSRFALLNRLQSAVKEGKYVQDWQQEVVDYSVNDAMIRDLFRLP